MGAGRSLATTPWGKLSVAGSRQDLARYLPSPLPTLVFLPQAWLPSHMPQLDGDGPPSSAGHSGLCARRSGLLASGHSKSSSAVLAKGSPEMAAGPDPVRYPEAVAQGGTRGMGAWTAPNTFSCHEDIVGPDSAPPWTRSESNKS